MKVKITKVPNLYSTGGGIHILPSKKGTFKALATRMGMGVLEAARHILANPEDYSSAMRKKANFARNFAHKDGGNLLFAEGGSFEGLHTNGLDWMSRGDFTEFNTGSSHENNGNEGVPQGIDSEGTPNLVEEGEIKYNNYIFSKRLKVPTKKELDSELKELPESEGGDSQRGWEVKVLKKYAGLSYADAAKKIYKEVEERPNDSKSNDTMEELLGVLRNSQEKLRAIELADKEAKEEKEQLKSMSDLEYAEAKEQLEAQEQAEIELALLLQIQLEQLALLLQQLALMSPEELLAYILLMLQLQMQPQGYAEGGDINDEYDKAGTYYDKKTKTIHYKKAGSKNGFSGSGAGRSFDVGNLSKHKTFNEAFDAARAILKSKGINEEEGVFRYGKNTYHTMMTSNPIREKDNRRVGSSTTRTILDEGMYEHLPAVLPGSTQTTFAPAYNEAIDKRYNVGNIRANGGDLEEKSDSFMTIEDAEELSTSQLNLTIDLIAQYAKLNGLRDIVKLARKIKKASREEKEEFVEDSIEEIQLMELQRVDESLILDLQSQELTMLELAMQELMMLQLIMLLNPEAMASKELNSLMQEPQLFAHGGNLFPDGGATQTYSTYGPITDFSYWDINTNDYNPLYKSFIQNLTDEDIKDLLTNWWDSNNGEKFSKYVNEGKGTKAGITAALLKDTSKGALDKKYSDLHKFAAALYDASKLKQEAADKLGVDASKTPVTPNIKYFTTGNVDVNTKKPLGTPFAAIGNEGKKGYIPAVTGAVELLNYNPNVPLKGYYYNPALTRDIDGTTYMFFDPLKTLDRYYTVDDEGNRTAIDDYETLLKSGYVKGTPETTIEGNTQYSDYTLTKPEDNEAMPKFPIWPGAVGLGLQAAGLAHNLIAPINYSNANAILNASAQAGNYIPVSPATIGTYVSPRRFDRNYWLTKAANQAAAQLAGILNTSVGNRATAAANLLASNLGYFNALGELARQGELFNAEQELKEATFNRGTELFNAEAIMKASMANQDAAARARALQLEGQAKAYAMKESARRARENAISQGLSGLAAGIGTLALNAWLNKFLGWNAKYAGQPGLYYGN